MRANLAALLLLPLPALAQWTVSEGTALSPDIADDDRIVFDLLGQLWLLPNRGSEAVRVDTDGLPVREPRFSPTAEEVLFQTLVAGQPTLARIHLESGDVTLLPGDAAVDGTWHPDGTRVTLSSGTDNGADLFDHDLSTGLRRRLTSLDGNESDPAWSSDGRDLAYIHQSEGLYRLNVRRFGREDETLVESTERLSSPSWRPDGSLLAYLRHGDEVEARMLILSEPMLDRELVSEPDLFDSPIAWAGRQRMVYAANGKLRRRNFNSWIPREVPFRASINPPPAPQAFERPPMPALTEPERRWVLRVSHVLSSDGERWLENTDVDIDGGRIRAVRSSFQDNDTSVLDLGAAWLVPGLIDTRACVADNMPASLGPLLLSLGVTTLVADPVGIEQLNDSWSGAEAPGPLLISRNRLGPVSQLADGSRVLAAHVEQSLEERWSPAGRQYADAALTRHENRYTYLSGQARPAEPVLDGLLSLRQAALLAGRTSRPFVPPPPALPFSAPVIVGSGCNGIPPGLATLAEVKSLLDTGRSPAAVLAAATRDAAEALSLPAGRIAEGHFADLVLLGADPLADGDAWERVIAVVRNGRFHSVSGLVDKAGVEKSYK